MAEPDNERNLLFGSLALQMDFITRDALITAMKTCAREKDGTIGQALLSQGALSADDQGLLNSLVQRFIELHDNNARRCLASVTTVAAIRDELEKLGDNDTNRTVDPAANSPGDSTEGRAPRALTPPKPQVSRAPVSSCSDSTPRAASGRFGSPRTWSSIGKWH